jgi:hypothetical protein
MNQSRSDPVDYIQFLIASQKTFTCTEAARCQPVELYRTPSHDSFTRLLQRQTQDTETVWKEAKAMTGSGGVLVVDDTTLDKPYAAKMDLVTWHWSGKHRCVVKGINLITLLWTDGKRRVPCDCRIYDAPVTGLTKNDRFQEMLTKAKKRGMNPSYVLYDSWYCSIDNLNLVTKLGWHFLTRLKSNRTVSLEDGKNVPVSDVSIPKHGRTVYLKEYGIIKVFRTVSKNGDAEHWATNNLSMNVREREELEKQGWSIEVYHRGIKQCCGVERSHVRKARSIISHILLSIRAFLRLEAYRIETGTSWYEAKSAIIRYAIRSYLSSPFCHLGSTA